MGLAIVMDLTVKKNDPETVGIREGNNKNTYEQIWIDACFNSSAFIFSSL
jgi:hypothetical protein